MSDKQVNKQVNVKEKCTSVVHMSSRKSMKKYVMKMKQREKK